MHGMRRGNVLNSAQPRARTAAEASVLPLLEIDETSHSLPLSRELVFAACPVVTFGGRAGGAAGAADQL